MKKNRTISFDYMMQNGEISSNPTEAATVQKIFKIYLDGSSLLAIANWMSSTAISYNGTTSAWNKNMIKRILENEKYIGEKGYPVIIDKEIFYGATAQKKMKSTTVDELPEKLQVIRSLTYCMECRHKLSRIGGNTRSEKQDCRNPECSRFHHRLTDNMLIVVIIHVLNTVIANPDSLDINSEISSTFPIWKSSVSKMKSTVCWILRTLTLIKRKKKYSGLRTEISNEMQEVSQAKLTEKR